MTTMYYEYFHFVAVSLSDFNTIVWCSRYNCVLLIYKHAFSHSSFCRPCMESQLGSKTRQTVEEGCVRSYQCSSQKIFH